MVKFESSIVVKGKLQVDFGKNTPSEDCNDVLENQPQSSIRTVAAACQQQHTELWLNICN